jgi:SAM-dependent methyltransferase
VEPGRRNWAAPEPSWGQWNIPEAELHLLPDDLAGMDTIELGCGTGYVSAWLARRGAKPVGIDNSAAQLATARDFQREFGVEFPLIHGNAERVPYPDGSFDLGDLRVRRGDLVRSVRVDPRGGEAAASRADGWSSSATTRCCQLCAPDELAPAGDRLLRDYFGLHRLDWPDDGSVEFALPYGEWFRLLRRHRLRDRGLPRAAGAGRRHPRLRLRDRRLVQAVAVRARLQGREARLTRAYPE